MNKINKANGRSPFVGAPLCLSLRARNMMKRTAVAKNSEKKHDACVMYGSYILRTQDIHQTSCCAETKGLQQMLQTEKQWLACGYPLLRRYQLHGNNLHTPALHRQTHPTPGRRYSLEIVALTTLRSKSLGRTGYFTPWKSAIRRHRNCNLRLAT